MLRFTLITIAVIITAIATLWIGLSKYGKFDLTDASDEDLASRYRLVCGAYPDVALDDARIPVELHSLIPLAKQYGHGLRILHEDCAANMSATERQRIAAEIGAKHEEIQRWLDRNPNAITAKEVQAFHSLLRFRRLLVPIEVLPEKTVS